MEMDDITIRRAKDVTIIEVLLPDGQKMAITINEVSVNIRTEKPTRISFGSITPSNFTFKYK